MAMQLSNEIFIAWKACDNVWAFQKRCALVRYVRTNTSIWFYLVDIAGLAQYCSNSSALALGLLQSCTNPLMYAYA